MVILDIKEIRVLPLEKKKKNQLHLSQISCLSKSDHTVIELKKGQNIN